MIAERACAEKVSAKKSLNCGNNMHFYAENVFKSALKENKDTLFIAFE